MAVARVLPLGGHALLAASVVSVVVAAVLPTVFVVVTGALVGAVPAAAAAGMHSAAGRHLQIVLGVMAATFLAQQLAAPAGQYFRDLLGIRITGAVHHRVMEASLGPAGIGHLEDPALLDQLETARGAGTSEVPPGRAASGLLTIWQRRLTGWGVLLVVARFNPWVAAVLAAELAVSYRLYLRGFHSYTHRFVAKEEDFRRAAYLRSLGTGLEGAKEIRIFGLGRWIGDRYRVVFEDAMAQLWARRGREGLLQLVPLTLDSLGLAFALGAIGRAGVHHTISVGRLTTYAAAVLGTIVLTALGDDELTSAWGAAALASANEVVRVMAERPSLHAGGRPADRLPQSVVRFENVTFAYPGRQPVFKSLDLTIEAGRSLAIVGVNGAGKTTLVKLLARLYDPDEGVITVDGTDVRDLDPVSWQRRIAAIFQDFTRYESYSLADNIGLGCVERMGDRAAVERAAERAGAANLAAPPATGWDTVLGRQYEGGIELSGGEWQRLALARALFATEGGAGVLVLDEPTANLDVRGETELYDRFLEMTRGVTTIVISHRFSTVRRADRIVVLDGGDVIESGTHDELVAAGGRYAEMFELQASRYREEPADA